MDLGLGLVGPNGKLSEVASGLEMAGRGDLGPDEDNEPRDGTAGLECMMRPTVGLSSTGTSEGEAARLRFWW